MEISTKSDFCSKPLERETKEKTVIGEDDESAFRNNPTIKTSKDHLLSNFNEKPLRINKGNKSVWEVLALG